MMTEYLEIYAKGHMVDDMRKSDRDEAQAQLEKISGNIKGIR